jgi:hypothetical protein
MSTVEINISDLIIWTQIDGKRLAALENQLKLSGVLPELIYISSASIDNKYYCITGSYEMV